MHLSFRFVSAGPHTMAISSSSSEGSCTLLSPPPHDPFRARQTKCTGIVGDTGRCQRCAAKNVLCVFREKRTPGPPGKRKLADFQDSENNSPRSSIRWVNTARGPGAVVFRRFRAWAAFASCPPPGESMTMVGSKSGNRQRAPYDRTKQPCDN